MNTNDDSGVSEAGVQDALRRARQIDPACTPEAVALYLREIAEMANQLDRIDLDDAPGAALFSPAWPSGGQQ